MNGNVKKVIAMTLIFGAFSSITPSTNLMTTKAYASASDVITSLKIKTSSGTTIRTYDNNDYKSENEVDHDKIEAGKPYYAKTSSNEIEISASGVNSDYVRVFKGTSSSDKGTRLGNTISLSETSTIVVRVYSENPGTVKYNDKTNMVSDYRIKVKYTGSDNGDEEDNNVYLKSISLSEGTLSFLKRTSTYDINVAEAIDEVTIDARPDCDSNEYDNYKVRIGGIKVDEDDKFKETVLLSEGKNNIEITVEDDKNNMRTYTLNITRGETTTTTTTTNSNDNNLSNNNSSNTELANSKNNEWIQPNGSIATGWLNYSGNWYYLGNDGAKKTGWQLVDGSWYYLDTAEGKMQTGWMKDITGKYYYLNSNGSMAYNTIIGGYILDANGVWMV